MTHPDIITAEIFGGTPAAGKSKIGECLYCEAVLCEDDGEVIESTDGLFCDMECCCEYYEITPLL